MASARDLDTSPDVTLDRITRIACSMLDAEGALVTMLDDHWQVVRSAAGEEWRHLAGEVVPAQESLCQYVVAGGAPLVVEDVSHEMRLKSRKHIEEQGIGTYLGVPLLDDHGHPIGAVCVLGAQPRRWTDVDIARLEDLAALASGELALRSTRGSLELLQRNHAAHETVTSLLTTGGTAQPGWHYLLEAVAEPFRADAAVMWHETSPNRLESVASWTHDGSTVDTLDAVGDPQLQRAWSLARPVEVPLDAETSAARRRVLLPVHEAGAGGVVELLLPDRAHEQIELDLLLALARRILVLSAVGAASQHRSGPTGDASAMATALEPPAVVDELPRVHLTPREHQVLEQLAVDAQNLEIAAALGISVDTVKTHVSSVLRKLGARSRSGAVVEAMRRGIVGDGR